MPPRFPAFLEIASRFHFHPTGAGKLAQPISFRSEFLLATRFVVRPFSGSNLANTVETGDEDYARRRLPRGQLRCHPREKVRS